MSKLPRMDAMELVQQPTAFSHEDWIYEIKYDGFRGLAYVQDEICQLVSPTNCLTGNAIRIPIKPR